MDIDLAALPSDIDTLHQLVRDLATQAAGDRSELAQAQAVRASGSLAQHLREIDIIYGQHFSDHVVNAIVKNGPHLVQLLQQAVQNPPFDNRLTLFRIAGYEIVAALHMSACGTQEPCRHLDGRSGGGPCVRGSARCADQCPDLSKSRLTDEYLLPTVN